MKMLTQRVHDACPGLSDACPQQASAPARQSHEIAHGNPQLLARITLEAFQGWRFAGNLHAIARISFDYGHGAVADALDTETVLETSHVDGAARQQIQRDLEREARHLTRLKRCNELARIDTKDCHPAAFIYAGRRPGPFTEAMELSHLANSLISYGIRVEMSEALKPRLRSITRAQLQVECVSLPESTAYRLDVRVPVGKDTTASISALIDAALRTPRLLDQIESREPADDVVYLPLATGELIEIPVGALCETLAPVLEWLQDAFDPRRRAFRLPRAAAASLALEADSTAHVPRSSLQVPLQALLEVGASPPVPVTPPGVHACLRPYQQLGTEWLNRLAAAGVSGVLADDMGLGKTLQILAHLVMRKKASTLSNPALIVCPTSLITNWRNEANRFAPDLRVLILHGPDRNGCFPAIRDSDIVITTYPLVGRDAGALSPYKFSLVVLDEAQAVQNPASKVRADIASRLNACQILPVTGTPLSNHLSELWSLMDLANPGLFGSLKTFRRLYRTPIEERGDTEAQTKLLKRLRPFLLRRTKSEVAAELPAKVEIVLPVTMGSAQRKLYERIRATQGQRVREALASGGMARSHILMLDALMKLRQACCDPRLVKLPSAKTIKESAKLEVLEKMLGELSGEGRKILVFSQFTSMLDLIEQSVRVAGISYARLDGDTKDREAQVQRFQQGRATVFLLSLKAGGTGLNLTAADTVIHYDPWWNPAAESQATDRAHRIGQDKTVWVYRLIAEDSIERRVQELQARKAELADAILAGGTTEGVALTEADVLGIFE